MYVLVWEIQNSQEGELLCQWRNVDNLFMVITWHCPSLVVWVQRWQTHLWDCMDVFLLLLYWLGMVQWQLNPPIPIIPAITALENMKRNQRLLMHSIIYHNLPSFIECTWTADPGATLWNWIVVCGGNVKMVVGGDEGHTSMLNELQFSIRNGVSMTFVYTTLASLSDLPAWSAMPVRSPCAV